MSAHIEHGTAPAEPWLILNVDGRHLPRDALSDTGGEDRSRQKLSQTLHAVEDASGTRSANRHTLRGNIQEITLVTQTRKRCVELKADSVINILAHFSF